jgi:hypothetical protein
LQQQARFDAFVHEYNSRRPHRTHDSQTPDVVYFNTLASARQAA